ncbi:MAG: glucosidase, partial [Acidobacteriota bacterium]
MNAEQKRLEESNTRTRHWKRWGPYLSERAWGTVREDYSPDGSAWDYFPHDHARSRAYRWNEDGIGGICDRHQRICFAIALWNGKDPILKERLFGLTGSEGNHGEDVKEFYYYLDSTPTHSYLKFLYKYPQAEFPYSALIEENRRRTKDEREYELIDTGIFDENKYFDVLVEYAKADIEDILIRITVSNRADEDAEINILPTVWFRNTWSWTGSPSDCEVRPGESGSEFEIECSDYVKRRLYFEGEPELLFTENETNNERVFEAPNHSPFVKDGIGRYVIEKDSGAVNPAKSGTKASANYKVTVPARGEIVLRLRLTDKKFSQDDAKTQKIVGMSAAFDEFDRTFERRIAEADEFYSALMPDDLSDDARLVQRQAFAGMLWSKQFYHYVVKEWLDGDPAEPVPPASRRVGRNHDWTHLYNSDVVSMPDKWEYPWYAAWDLAF